MSSELIPASSAKWLVEQMKVQGVNYTRILAGTGLNESWVNQENAMISHDQYRKIVNNAFDESDDPALGLTLPNKSDLSWHGYWGYAMISSSNWLEAVQFAVNYWDLNGSLVKLFHREENGKVIFDVLPTFPMVSNRLLRYAVEEWLTLATYDFQFTTGITIADREIYLSYPEPEYGALYQQIFNCPVHFDCPTNQLIIPLEVLKAPIISANPKIAEFCIQQCESMLESLDRTDPLIESIRQLLIITPGYFPGFNEIAEKLKISQRTLSRRLQDRNTTYKNIVN
jgi:AraC-type transcriptional regulator